MKPKKPGKPSRQERADQQRQDDLELLAIERSSSKGTKRGDELAEQIALGMARRKGHLR